MITVIIKEITVIKLKSSSLITVIIVKNLCNQ